MRTHAARRGFTFVELLVAAAVIAALLALLVPAYQGARAATRTTRCAANLHTLAVAARAFQNDHDERLPHYFYDIGGGEQYHIAVAFGGRAGALPLLGLDTLGADRRPLNPYLASDSADAPADLFADPADTGGLDPFLIAPEPSPDTLFEQVGNSYTLNGAAIDDNPCPLVDVYPTFALPAGARPPRVTHPARTWIIGDLPIMNYDDAGDRGYRWHAERRGGLRANLAFADLHVATLLATPDARDPAVGIAGANTTPDYTFLPDEAAAPAALRPTR